MPLKKTNIAHNKHTWQLSWHLCINSPCSSLLNWSERETSSAPRTAHSADRSNTAKQQAAATMMRVGQNITEQIRVGPNTEFTEKL